MNPPSSSSQRLPSFRDPGGLQKVILPLNKNKILSKKTYVPNLNLSRSIQPRSKPVEEKSAGEIKKEVNVKEPHRGRPERKVITASETFVPQSSSNRIPLSLKSKSQILGSATSFSHETFNRDNIGLKDSLTYEPSRTLWSESPEDAPIRISQCPPIKSQKLSLLTKLKQPDSAESPIFLLKTPKYLPAVLDESNDRPKIPSNDKNKNGFKCTVHDLPAGQIGKLQILKSGRLRLVLGECSFWLQQGVKVNFMEELAVVNADKEAKTGEIICIGNVHERVVVVPDVMTKLGINR